jgi:hypothetical protein
VREGALAPPDVSASPRVRVSTWEAWAATDGRGALVVACFDVRTDTWTPDADELAEAKLTETIAGTAVRAHLGGVGNLDVTDSRRQGEPLVRAYAAHGEVSVVARSVQGFVRADTPTLASCFALCLDKETPMRCEEAARTAEFSRPFVPAPAPGTALRALGALVHHPTATAWGGVALLVALGALALATRKRPKRRRLW